MDRRKNKKGEIMDIKDLINKNFSKKEGISLGSIGALLAIGAPPWMIVIVAVVSILTQGSQDITKEILTFFKEKQNEKSNSNGGSDSTDSKSASPS